MTELSHRLNERIILRICFHVCASFNGHIKANTRRNVQLQISRHVFAYDYSSQSRRHRFLRLFSISKSILSHLWLFFSRFFAAIRYFPIVEENKSQLQWERLDYGKRKIHLSNAILSAFDPEAIVSYSNQSHGFLFPEKISLQRFSEHYLPIKNAFLCTFIVKHSLLSHHFRCGINFAVVTNHLHT